MVITVVDVVFTVVDLVITVARSKISATVIRVMYGLYGGNSHFDFIIEILMKIYIPFYFS